jgi:hypothetical protein
MNTVYAVRVDLGSGNKAALGAAALAVRWAKQGGATDPAWEEGTFEDGGRRVHSSHADRDGYDVYQVELDHADSSDRHLRWHATADIVGHGGRTSMTLLLSQERAVDVVVPHYTQPGPPRLISDLISTGGARDGRHLLSTGLRAVRGLDGVEELVEGLLLDGDRRLPVVLFTPCTDTGTTTCGAAEVEDFCRRTLAMAHVVQLGDMTDTYALSDRVGRQFSAWDGAIRVYWPRLALQDNPRQHALIVRPRVSAFTLPNLARRLHEANIRAYRELPGVSLLRAFREGERELQEHTRGLKELQNYKELAELYEISNVELEQTNSDLARQVAQAQLEMQRLTDEKDQLDSEKRALKYQLAQKLRTPADAVEDESEDGEQPETFAEVIELAEEEFSTTLRITQPAADMARECNPIHFAPAKLWSTLHALHRIVSRWQENDIPRGFRAAFEEEGLDLSDLKQTTVGRHKQAYSFRHDDAQVQMTAHTKLSAGDRIYWYQCADCRQFIINHIGEHLPDSTT